MQEISTPPPPAKGNNFILCEHHLRNNCPIPFGCCTGCNSEAPTWIFSAAVLLKRWFLFLKQTPKNHLSALLSCSSSSPLAQVPDLSSSCQTYFRGSS